MEIKTTQKARTFLLIGLVGGVLTLIGDLLIGYVKFPDGAGMIESYFAAALALPVWRPILGGMAGFLGISLEFLGLMTVYPLLKKNMPRGAAFYRLSMYVYLQSRAARSICPVECSCGCTTRRRRPPGRLWPMNWRFTTFCISSCRSAWCSMSFCREQHRAVCWNRQRQDPAAQMVRGV